MEPLTKSKARNSTSRYNVVHAPIPPMISRKQPRVSRTLLAARLSWALQTISGGSAAFIGTDLETSFVRRRIFEKTQPNLDVVVKEISYSGKRLLAVEIQEGLDVYVANGKAAKRRLETSCIALSGTDLMRLSDERRGTDWSGVPSGRLATDIDETALLNLRALLRRSRNAPDESTNASTIDLLAMLNLVDPDGYLTRAGELFLCRPSPTEARDLLVYQYRETPGGEVRAGRRWQAPLLSATVEALSVMEARIGTIPLNLSSGQQIQIEDYPILALREALANALTHGDLRERRPVMIEHSPQSVVITSPGPLVAGITPDNILTHPPKPRFPSLAAAMRAVGLARAVRTRRRSNVQGNDTQRSFGTLANRLRWNESRDNSALRGAP